MPLDDVPDANDHEPAVAEPDAPHKTYVFGAPPGDALSTDEVCRRWAASPPPLDSSTKVGEYHLERELGRGGMGVVFEASSERVEHRVALKVLLHDEFARKAEQERFLMEAQLQVNLRHDNVVPVLHVGQHGVRVYFTMPLMSRSLAQVMADRGSERPSSYWRGDVVWMAQAARGVHELHENRGLLHCDIKPANILLDEDESQHKSVARIADFGLARTMIEELSRSDSRVGAGTEAYMSPEQADGAIRLTWMSDIYGLGAVLYALLTGAPPPRKAGIEAVEGGLLRARAEDPTIPGDLERVCLKCLEHEPTRRYHRADDLADDLERISRGQPSSIPPLSGLGKVGHWIRRHPAAFVALLASFLGALTLGIALATWWDRIALELRAAGSRIAHRTVTPEVVLEPARAVAADMLAELREVESALAAVAREPEILRLAANPGVELVPGGAPGMDPTCSDHTDVTMIAPGRAGLVDAALFTRDGCVVGHYHELYEDHNHFRVWFGYRNYIKEAVAVADRGEASVISSSVFRSKHDGVMKLGLSIPVQSGNEKGVLASFVRAEWLFDLTRHRTIAPLGTRAIVLVPRDSEQDFTQPGPEFRVFSYSEDESLGDEFAVSGEIAEVIHQTYGLAPAEEKLRGHRLPSAILEGCANPIPKRERYWQRAVLVPIGSTGYTIVVVLETGEKLDGGSCRIIPFE